MRLQGGPWLTVASLRGDDGAELLVDAAELPPEYRVHGERAGITLLHPWANRLSRPVDHPRARHDPHGAPIHGLPAAGAGWTLRGDVATLDADWPAPHRVTVRFERVPGALTVTTELEAAEPVPVAFGWHPYLRAPRDWVLELPAHRRLELDARNLPTGRATDEPASAVPLGDRELDDALDGLAPGAVLAAGPLRVELVEGYPAAHVFAPLDVPLVSLEPMAAPVDGWDRAARATSARAAWRLSWD